jgi:hypothetical protein
MCGRVIQSSGPLRYGSVAGMDMRDAPSQDLLVIRRNHDTGVVSLDPLRWGLIPHLCQDPTGGRKPINAKCETVHRLPMFKEAYRRRRCIAVQAYLLGLPVVNQVANRDAIVAFGRHLRCLHQPRRSDHGQRHLPGVIVN